MRGCVRVRVAQQPATHFRQHCQDPEQVTEPGNDPDQCAGRGVGHDPVIYPWHERQACVEVDAQEEREGAECIERVQSIVRFHTSPSSYRAAR